MSHLPVSTHSFLSLAIAITSPEGLTDTLHSLSQFASLPGLSAAFPPKEFRKLHYKKGKEIQILQ
jgi:hypothetical protein